ncbi:MAG: hypothetical protein ABI665_09140 [Vicinamibacterales bacterium]
MVRSLKIAGVGFIVIAVLIVLWPIVLATLGIMAALVLSAWVAHRWRQWRAVAAFRTSWGVGGRDLLLVYSNSPHWKDYIEQNWLPRFADRVVLLNWSERGAWKVEHPIEAALFHAFAGEREFNPLAVVIPKRGSRARVVHFWLAFRDFKHGKEQKLRMAERELDDALSRNRGMATTMAKTPGGA